MNFLRLNLVKYKSNTGDKFKVDLCCNLDTLVYADMAESPNRLLLKFQDDMNVYYAEDPESVSRLLSAMGQK